MARRLLLVAAAVLALLLVGLAPTVLGSETGSGFFAPRERSMVDTILIASWWMAIPNLVLCLLLARSAPHWSAKPVDPSAATERGTRRPGVGFWLLVLLAMGLGAFQRWELAHGSLWWDEAWTVKRAVVGHREPLPDDPERLEFRQVRWHWTLFHYKKPTNHVLYSAAARVSNELWRLRAGAPPWAFDEFALRRPAFAAALLSIAVLAFLLRSWVSPAAGVAGAFFLALHPWHVEHGPELRAYGFIGLLVLASCFLLVRVLRGRSWPALLAYGALQLLLLWSHPFTVFFVLSMGLWGLVGILRGDGPREVRRAGARRFFVAHLLVGMLWLQVFAPNLAQVPLWTDVHEPSKGRVVQRRALESLAGLVFSGLPRKYGRDDADGARFPSLHSLAAESPWVAPAVFGLIPLLTGLGFARLVSRRAPERWVALGLGLAAPTAIAVSWLGALFFHERFVFYAVVAVVVFAPAGAEGVLRFATALAPRVGRVAVPLGLAATLAGFHALVEPRNGVLRERPYAPMRELGAYLTHQAGIAPTSVVRLGYASGADVTDIYDPWIVQVHGDEEIAEAMARARADGRPLYVFYGYAAANRPRFPSGFRLLDDPALFETTAHFLGADPHFSYWVLRHTGAPAPG